jgi:hypothetical protein
MEKSANFVTRRVLEHTLLIPMNAFKEGDFLRLNESGSYLWNNLDKFPDEPSMVQALMDRYAIDMETAKAGVEGFIQGLNQFKVIQ